MTETSGWADHAVGGRPEHVLQDAPEPKARIGEPSAVKAPK